MKRNSRYEIKKPSFFSNGRRKYLFIVVLFTMLFSCKKPGKLNDYHPGLTDSVKARGHIIAKSERFPPWVVPVSEVKKRPAGKPKVTHISSQERLAGIPEITLAGSPRICTPGKEIYELPGMTPARGIFAAAGPPEIVLVKDASIKDIDPESFSSFKILQGLKHNIIRCMIQDKAGNLWFGTYGGGVTRFDGKYFTNYTNVEGLSSNSVWSILEDKAGNLWFGTYSGGLNKFDGKTFTHYSTAEGLVNNNVYSILEDKTGNLWLGTDGGISKYDGKSFTNYTTAQGLCNNLIRCGLEDKSGNLWFGTQGGVSKFNGKSFLNYTTVQGLCSNYINCIVEDKTGILWFGTNGGVTKYDGVSFSNYTTMQGLSNNTVLSIGKEKNGNLWFGTKGGGVNKFNGIYFTHYTTAEGLSSDIIFCIMEDRVGNLWLCTNGGGFCNYQGKLFSHYTVNDGLTNNIVVSILEDRKGNLWFGTWGGGVSKFDGKSFYNYSTAQGLGNDVVLSMLEDKAGNIWFGTQGNGLSKFDGQNFTNYNADEGFSNEGIWNMVEDKAGNLWFGTYGGGVIKFDGKTYTHFSGAQGLSDEVVHVMIDKAGDIWSSTWGKGVNRYDGSSFTNYTISDGLSNNQVAGTLQDRDGNIWIATSGGGIDKYDGKTFINYNTNQGLSNNNLTSMMEDDKGNLWFGTRRGLNRMIRQKGDISAGHTFETNSETWAPVFKNYLSADGFLGLNCYQNSILEDSHGSIWIGTGDRLTCYHPQGEIPDTVPPNIQMSNVALFNENINWSALAGNKDTTLVLGNGVRVADFTFDDLSKWYSVPKNLSLTYNNNYLTFKFIGITLKNSYNVKYQYKMEGLDKNWSTITDRNEAPYGNLASGKYTFKVKAVNSEGFWSNELKYPFTITPPWWESTWFRSFEFVFIALVLYSIYRYRLNQVLKMQSIRNKIANDLHDDIGSTLNSISIYSQIARQEPQKIQEALEMIGDSSRKVIDAMSDIVWAVNPNNDSFENILLRMRSIAFNLLGAKKIDYTFRADENLNNIRLSMEIRRNLFLIFKESLNNLVKYAEASLVSIQIYSEGAIVKLVIRDNGKGFDLLKPLDGNGLNSMRRRAKEMKAQLVIETTIGEGTRIALNLKL
jgi:ligand-binding sensor domain-containing protein/two-component sensor histidine kinase